MVALQDDRVAGDVAGQLPGHRAMHIKKRALKNKSISISFNEKDLMDYVTGFHKRKKKRRKEAMEEIEMIKRRKRIELRRKRKLNMKNVESDGAELAADIGLDGCTDGDDPHEECDPNHTISGSTGTRVYDVGDTKIKVVTTEISNKIETENPIARDPPNKKVKSEIKKIKAVKKIKKQRSLPKQQKKRDKRKGKRKDRKKC